MVIGAAIGRVNKSVQFHVIDLAAAVQQTSRKMGVFPFGLLESFLLQPRSARFC